MSSSWHERHLLPVAFRWLFDGLFSGDESDRWTHVDMSLQMNMYLSQQLSRLQLSLLLESPVRRLLSSRFLPVEQWSPEQCQALLDFNTPLIVNYFIDSLELCCVALSHSPSASKPHHINSFIQILREHLRSLPSLSAATSGFSQRQPSPLLPHFPSLDSVPTDGSSLLPPTSSGSSSSSSITGGGQGEDRLRKRKTREEDEEYAHSFGYIIPTLPSIPLYKGPLISEGVPPISFKLLSTHQDGWIQVLKRFLAADQAEGGAIWSQAADEETTCIRLSSSFSNVVLMVRFPGEVHDNVHVRLLDVKMYLSSIEKKFCPWNTTKYTVRGEVVWVTEPSRKAEHHLSRTIISLAPYPKLWVVIYHRKQRMTSHKGRPWPGRQVEAPPEEHDQEVSASSSSSSAAAPPAAAPSQASAFPPASSSLMSMRNAPVFERPSSSPFPSIDPHQRDAAMSHRPLSSPFSTGLRQPDPLAAQQQQPVLLPNDILRTIPDPVWPRDLPLLSRPSHIHPEPLAFPISNRARANGGHSWTRSRATESSLTE